MTVRDRIVERLKAHAEGMDDDMLTEALGLSRRQHANQVCRKLESAGLVERRLVNGKTRNFLRDGRRNSEAVAQPVLSVQPVIVSESVRKHDKPWYWEGNVQSAVVTFLVSSGFMIRRVADTLTREHGKDVIAVSSSGRELWVSIKGQPDGTKRTSPHLMARHYFEAAVHDLLCWRDEDKSVSLALGLPDFVTYRSGARKIAGRLLELKANILWVSKDGKVETSPDFL
jgi:hypothetical protein